MEECVKVTHTYREIDWGDVPGSKAHATQAWGLSLSPRNLHKSRVWWRTLVNPMLKRQIQKLQGVVGNQPSLSNGSQVLGKDQAQKATWVDPKE